MRLADAPKKRLELKERVNQLNEKRKELQTATEETRQELEAKVWVEKVQEKIEEKQFIQALAEADR